MSISKPKHQFYNIKELTINFWIITRVCVFKILNNEKKEHKLGKKKKKSK